MNSLFGRKETRPTLIQALDEVLFLPERSYSVCELHIFVFFHLHLSRFIHYRFDEIDIDEDITTIQYSI